ncbi:MAG: type II toxin-antitoxin system RelE/ParE family toxin [Methylococcales bacterium]
MRIRQTGIFKRRAKKLHSDEKTALDEAIQAIVDDPTIGQIKTGDLAGVQVYKYKHNGQQYLLAYRLIEAEALLILLALGMHENFYRDLKRQ